MNRERTWALALRIIRTFRHDRRTLGLIVIVPLVVMALIGYMVGDSGKEPLRVGVVPPALTPGGEAAPVLAFQDQLRRRPGIRVTDVTSEAMGRARVAEGSLDGLVLAEPIGVGPTASLGRITLVTPGLDVQVETPIALAAATAAAEVRGLHVTPGDLPGITVDRVSLPANRRPSTISYAAPAMITVFGFLFTFMITSVSFLRERSSGTLERLLASPIRAREILAGYMVGFVPFASIQALIVLAYATLILHAQIAGPVWLVFAVLILLVLGVVNLGIALSFEARTELQVIQFIPLVLLPQVFLCGLFWPIRTLWPPLQWISKLLPMTYAVRALREVMLAGAGLIDIAPELAALAVFALAMIVLGTAVLRRLRV
ncbi:MAG TPA: ABC transporter permease [Actinomycetota bacterium]|nr:ABC transporter permease [Actinomycetota bacterium]